MKVKIKKLHKDAIVPSYAKPGDAGLDLTAVSISFDEDGNTVFGTGLAFAIPKGYVGLVFPRSSNAKTNMYLTNSVGVIDSGYRGEVTLKYKTAHNTANFLKLWWYKYVLKRKGYQPTIECITNNPYKVGDRVGQIIILPYPSIEFEETKTLSRTKRGTGGYGSSGK